ncbi:MAG: hypothetical protein ACM3NQ_25785, partial [Bacteroidales bacterium]
KQFERERQSKEQYQRLYEQEKAKKNELKESFKTDNENKTAIYWGLSSNGTENRHRGLPIGLSPWSE